MHDPNDLLAPASADWELQYAYAINDVGQIVGLGIHNGMDCAFLATLSSADIPEPSSLVLVGAGIGALAVRRRVRR